MLSLSKIKEETDKLCSLIWDWFEVIDNLSPDEARGKVSQDDSGVITIEGYDFLEILEEMEKWYNCSLQLMKETGYVGLDEFKQLFKDEKFSMFSYLNKLFNGKDLLLEEEINEFEDRFFQMAFILNALPDAIATVREKEFLGSPIEMIFSYIEEAIKISSEDPLNAATKGRLAIEKGVNFLCLEKNIVVTTSSDQQKFTRPRASFCVKVYALSNAGIITSAEEKEVKDTYKICSEIMHGDKTSSPISTFKEHLETTKQILKKLINEL
jgi:hypothetical protein